jgi:hypothetical protein
MIDKLGVDTDWIDEVLDHFRAWAILPYQPFNVPVDIEKILTKAEAKAAIAAQIDAAKVEAYKRGYIDGGLAKIPKTEIIRKSGVY